MGEEGEGDTSGQEKVFCDQDAKFPQKNSWEKGWENVLEDVKEICGEKEEEIDSKDDGEDSAQVGSNNEPTSSQCWTILLTLDRDHDIEQCCTDAVENAGKNEEDAPEEDKALA